jgi:ubiquitin-protein ligase
VSTNPVPGTQVQLAEEGNVFLWEVIMQGPEDSIYAVCISALFSVSSQS